MRQEDLNVLRAARLWFVNTGRLVLSNRRYGNLMLARELCASFLFQQEGFAGLKGERGDSRRGAGLKGLRAEAGNVKTQVVVFLGHFNGNGAAARPGQRTATGEAWIGAFKGLNGQHGALFDQDRLADFQARNLFGDAETKVHIRLLRRRQLWPELETTSRHQGFQPRGGLDQLNALALQFVGNRAEDRVSILFPQPQQQREGAEIGSDIKQALGGDLAGHDAVLDAAVGEGGQHL